MERVVKVGAMCMLFSTYQTRMALLALTHCCSVRQRVMVNFLVSRLKERRRRRLKRLATAGLTLLQRPRARSIWVSPRPCTWWQHINENWNDTDWQLNFRMKRVTFQHLCNILRPSLTRQRTRCRYPVPVDLRVAICLWRLATNLRYSSISHLFGVGMSTACHITQEVVTAINREMKRHYIKVPSDEELRAIVQGYREKWSFPQAAGAIDSTHIGILAPAEHPADYYNRNGFYSIVLQGVVDHKIKFWDINVGWPGQVHDARVFANSNLYCRGQSGTLLPGWTEQLEGVDVPLVILGDAEYPLLPWLLKPFPAGGGVTPAETQFNHRLSQARTTVERAFRRLKGRWRCLLKRCDAHISLVSHIVAACCVLHNYCEIHNEQWDDDDDDEEAGDDDALHQARDDEEASDDDLHRAQNGEQASDDEEASDDDLHQAQDDEDAQHGGRIRDALCAYFSH